MEAVWANHKASIIAVAALIVMLLSSIIVVDETEQVVIIRTGEPVTVVNRFKPNQPFGRTGAGVWYRIPLWDRVERIDKRVLNVDMESGVLLTLATLYGLWAGCICVVSDRTPWPGPAELDIDKNMGTCIRVARDAMLALAR